MDRKEFENDLIVLLQKHGFHTNNVTKIKIEVDVQGVFLVTIEVQQ